MDENTDDGELHGSELGTISYWNDAYAAEIANFKQTGDVGEVWFGEDSLIRVVDWFSSSDIINKNDSIIDIGCGNGMSLLELAREGFSNLTGIDYSEPAIKLATDICKAEFPQIQYKVFDIVENDLTEFTNKFKVAHDKGTYDAVSLNPEDSKIKRNLYINRVAQILENSGLFVITSCNWTESELYEHFKEVFSIKKIIPTPQFKYGGKVGNIVTSIVFEKINK